MWVNEIFEGREKMGNSIRFFLLLEHPCKFFYYFRMLPETFWYILNDIRDDIQKQSNFHPVQTGPGAHPPTGSFPGVKCGRGFLLTTHPLLVSRSWKNRAITLPTLWTTPGL